MKNPDTAEVKSVHLLTGNCEPLTFPLALATKSWKINTLGRKQIGSFERY